jgi:hypothetical protein
MDQCTPVIATLQPYNGSVVKPQARRNANSNPAYLQYGISS